MAMQSLKPVHYTGKRGRTRARLTDTALKLMSERGIGATSVSEITAVAELGKGTFYLYFKDKADIVTAVSQAVTSAIHDEMSKIRTSSSDAAARVALGTFKFVEIAASEPTWGRLLISAPSEFGAIEKEVAQHVRLAIALGVDQGLFTTPADEFVIDCHLAILRAAVSARLAGAGRDVAKRAAEYQLNILGMMSTEVQHVLQLDWREADEYDRRQPKTARSSKRIRPASFI